MLDSLLTRRVDGICYEQVLEYIYELLISDHKLKVQFFLGNGYFSSIFLLCMEEKLKGFAHFVLWGCIMVF